jgi:hypothetical protein
MTEELILKWLNVVWKRQLDTLLHKCTMMILDSFHGHTRKGVKAEVNKDSNILVNPRQMIKLLQPLHFTINQSFKVTFQQLYNQWMTTTKHEMNPCCIMNCILLPTVCKWIPAA